EGREYGFDRARQGDAEVRTGGSADGHHRSGGGSAGRSVRRRALLDESLQRAYAADWKQGHDLTGQFRRGRADRDPERREPSQVEAGRRLKGSHGDRWNEGGLGPQQTSGDDSDDRQEEELQTAQRDGGPAAHGAAADINRHERQLSEFGGSHGSPRYSQ